MRFTILGGDQKGTRVMVNGREATIIGHEIRLYVKYDMGGTELLDQEDVEYHRMYKRETRR